MKDIKTLTNEVIEEIENYGYEAEYKLVTKNGIKFHGIVAGHKDQKVRPTIYFNETMNKDDIVNMILEHIDTGSEYNNIVSNLFNMDYIAENIYIGVNKLHENTFSYRKIEGTDIIEFLYIRIENEATVKINDELINNLKTTYEDLREIAIRNTLLITETHSLAELMAEKLGVELPPFEEDEKLFVITNKYNIYGAGAILLKPLLNTFCMRFNTHKIIILPSSIHEIIIAPLSEKDEISSFNDMVKEINENEVEPEIRLSDKAIIYEMERYTQI